MHKSRHVYTHNTLHACERDGSSLQAQPHVLDDMQLTLPGRVMCVGHTSKGACYCSRQVLQRLPLARALAGASWLGPCFCPCTIEDDVRPPGQPGVAQQCFVGLVTQQRPPVRRASPCALCCCAVLLCTPPPLLLLHQSSSGLIDSIRNSFPHPPPDLSTCPHHKHHHHLINSGRHAAACRHPAHGCQAPCG